MKNHYQKSMLRRITSVTLIWLLALLAFGSVQAQTPPYYNIVPTVNTNTFPFNTGSSTGKRVQWKLEPGAFSNPSPAFAGNITSLWVYSTTSPTATYTNLTIRFAAVPSSYFFTIGSFYTGAMSTSLAQNTAISGAGWKQIVLTTPYLYDPSQGLIIEISHCGYSGTGFSLPQDIIGAAPNYNRQYSDASSLCGSVALSSGGDVRTAGFGFTLVPALACSGTPAPGSTVATPSGPVCPAQTVNLNISGFASLGSGVNFQWQSSSFNGGYTDISGANSATYSTTVSSNTWFQCVVTCTNPGGSSFPSTPVQVTTSGSPMSGPYTINSALVTGGTNYQTFNAAVADMVCRGVSGPVTFNVNASSGPYSEQVVIPAITGASAANTITFNGNGRTLTYAASLSTDPATLELNGADYIRVNNLNVIGTGATYALVCHLWNNADNNIFTGCTFTAPTDGTGSTQIPYSVSASKTSSSSSGANSGVNNLIDNCTLNNGYAGVRIYGNSSSSPSPGNHVKNCTINDFYYYGIDLNYQDGAIISNNLLQRLNRITFTTTSYYMDIYYNINTLIERNRLRNPYYTNPSYAATNLYGIRVYNGTSGSGNLVYNNLISDFQGGGTHYGLYLYQNTVKAWHNTISFENSLASGTTTTYGVYLSMTAINQMDVRNNNITISRGGTGTKYGVYFASATYAQICNYNNIFVANAAGTKYVGYRTSGYLNLAAWQATGYDLNSVSVDPNYVSPGNPNYNYQPQVSDLNNTGANVGVGDDINGLSRTLASPDIGAYEYSLGGLDAAISWVSPTSPTTAGLKTITVAITNAQVQTITSVQLSYSDGGAPVTQTFTGLSITAGNSQNLSFSTQYNLTGAASMTVNILSVNGGSDAVVGNNTDNYNLCIGLSGVYTINSAVATGGINFQTFNDAVAAMSCGIIGPVTFNVAAGSGPYNEQVAIPQITGASSVNTITFNGNNAVLTYAATSSTARHTLLLDGADYIRFNNLVITATGSSYGWATHLYNGADNNIFTGCSITTSVTATSSTHVAFVMNGSTSSATTGETSSNHDNNIVDGCTLVGGYYCAIMMGETSTVKTSGNQIKNSTLKDFYYYGAYLYYQNGILFSNNIVERPTRLSSSTFYGIYLYYCDNLLVERNRVRKPFTLELTSGSTAYGIYGAYLGGLSSPGNQIQNNLISDFEGTGSHYGFYLSTSADKVRLYHNTIVFNYPATSGITYGVYFAAGSDRLLHNNSIEISRGGTSTKYMYYSSSSTYLTSFTSNYNNLYFGPSTGGTLYYGYFSSTSTYTTIGAWQGTGKDLNSTSANPVYQDPGNGNYTPTSSSVDNTGINLGIPTDITGFARSATPDVGAYEFILAPIDLAAHSLITPVQGECQTATQSVVVRVRNAGTMPLNFASNPATITVNVTGGTTATLTGTINSGTLAVNATQDVTLSGTLNMSALGSYTFAISASVIGDGNPYNDAIAPVTINRVFAVGTISSPVITPVCASSPAPVLSLIGATGGNIQWQSSTFGATGPWTNVGTGANTYDPVSLSQNTWFQVEITCGALVDYSNVWSVSVINPQIIGTSPASRCGAGTVSLGATASSGNSVNWYDVPVGGTPLAINTSSFTTPLILNTTTYYAEANSGGAGVQSLGPNPQGTTGGFTSSTNNYGLIFTVTSAVTIQSVDCYFSSAAGTAFTLIIENSSTSTIDFTYSGTVSVVNSGTPTTPQVLPLNATLSPGNYIMKWSVSPTSWRQSSLAVYPFTIPGIISITDNTFGAGYYYYFWNWQIVTGCGGTRVPVTATVTPSPAIYPTSSASVVCAENDVSLSVSSSNSNYGYSWSSSPVGFTGTGEGPFTVNPTVNTTYAVYAYDPGTQCGAYGELPIVATPNTIIAAATATPSVVCSGSDAQLNVSAAFGVPASDYQFTASTGTFTPLAGGTAISGILVDDAWSPAIPIGFGFNFEGVNYTQFYANSNGFISLGGNTAAAVPMRANDLPAGPAAADRPVIAPFWDDASGNSSSTASYQVSGAVGNRILTIEFLNWESYFSLTQANISFQIKLHEADGKIEFIYRQEAGPAYGSQTASIGLGGDAVGNYLSLSDASASPVASSTINTQNISLRPATGQVYTFTPPAGGAFDYAWSSLPAATLSATNITNPVAQNITAPTSFIVLVTDQVSGCTRRDTVDVTVNPVPVPSLVPTGYTSLCEGGIISLEALDGLSYLFTGPDNYSETTTAPTPFIPVQVFPTYSAVYGQHGGYYYVTATNSYNCSTTDSVFIDVLELPSLTLVGTVTPSSCPEAAGNIPDGGFTVVSNTGTAPFDYIISYPSVPNNINSTGVFTDLWPGDHYVDIISSNGCLGAQLVVNVPQAPNVPPVLDCPAPISVNTDAGVCGATVNFTVTASDNCPDGLGAVIQTGGLPSGSVFPVGTTINTFEVTDAASATTTCSFTVTVTDMEAPNAVCQNITVQLDPSGNASITASQVDGGSNDACGVASISASPLSFTCANVGPNPVVLTVTDINGNISSCTATVTVEDNVPPVALCQNVTIYLDANGQSSTTAAAVNNGSNDACGIASLSLSQTNFDCSETGANPVVLTVTDVNGNVSTCNATVTVVDAINPTITCSQNISVNNDLGVCGAAVSYSVTANDNCPGFGIVQTAGLASGATFPVGTTTNTFVVTDASGNTATCSFNVTVTDTEYPAFTGVPADFSACNPVSWIPPVGTDNCPGVSVVSSHTPPFTFPPGTTTVTYTATDAYNQQTSVSFNVTVLPPSVEADSISSNRAYNNICVGENATLTVNGGILGHLADWKWYAGGCGTGASIGSGPSITVAPTVTTTYYARAEGFCNTTACVSITIVVSSGAPTATPTYTVIPAYGAPGVTDVISVAPVPGATYYQWFTNNGQINGVLFNNQLSPVQTVPPTVNITFVLSQQNYQIRVFAGNACGRTGQRNTHIRGTVAATTCINGPTQVCPGTPYAYSACPIPSQSGNSAVSYQWSLNPSSAGTISGSGTNVSVTFNSGFTSAQVCVAGVSAFGLVGPSYCITVTTNAPSPGAISGPVLPCEGATGQVYSIAALPNPNVTGYVWSTNIPGATINGSGTSVTVDFPNNAYAGNICVVATTSNCGNSLPTCLAVTSDAPGNPGAIVGPVLGVCNSSNVNYTVGTGANNYSWTLPAGVTYTGASNLSSINLNFGPSFTSGTVSVTAYYDCGSATSSIFVDGVPPAPTITPADICTTYMGGLYTASATSATSYNWTLTNAIGAYCDDSPTCSQYFVGGWNPGGAMSVTATNSCGTSAPTNLSENCRVMGNGNLGTVIYPNPTHGKATLEFETEKAGTMVISLTDLSGRAIETREMKANAGVNRTQLDLSTYGAGMYLVYLTDADGNSSVTRLAVE